MTLDPRARWGMDDSPLPVAAPVMADRLYIDGANDRLAALLPQLVAADTLADAADDLLREGDVTRRERLRERLSLAHFNYLAARDAHLTEGTEP